MLHEPSCDDFYDLKLSLPCRTHLDDWCNTASTDGDLGGGIDLIQNQDFGRRKIRILAKYPKILFANFFFNLAVGSSICCNKY